MTMMIKNIDSESLVLKAAQTVWAVNKYFILACSQQDYRNIRNCLKPQQLNLNLAYQLIKKQQLRFQSVPGHLLPEIENTLYHMAGFFKNNLKSNQKAALNELIKQDAAEAFRLLEQYTIDFHVNYLLQSNIWNSNRWKTFNIVNTTLKEKNSVYKPGELFWYGDYCKAKIPPS